MQRWYTHLLCSIAEGWGYTNWMPGLFRSQTLPLKYSTMTLSEQEKPKKSEQHNTAEPASHGNESENPISSPQEIADKAASSNFEMTETSSTDHLNDGLIPCPADGDTFIFCTSVADFLSDDSYHCVAKDNADNPRYAVLENNDTHLLKFVICLESTEKSRQFKLISSRPGFDCLFLWEAEDTDENPWLFCIHFPISGQAIPPRDSIPEIASPEIETRMGDTIIQVYPLSGITTLRSWRESLEFVSPGSIHDILDMVFGQLNELRQHNHTILRISPDTIILNKDNVSFMGVCELKQPWNERCAQDHPQIEHAAIPPECYGYLRQKMTRRQRVYQLGAITYFLIAGKQIPTCESLGFDPAIEPRAFNPNFPIGWDEIVHKAIMPNPDMRFETPEQYMKAIHDALELMYERRDYRASLTYDVAVDTHIGITKRLRCPVNQDTVFVRQSEDGQRILMVVADGVSTSTYGTGDIASNMVAEVAEKFWNEHVATDDCIDSEEVVHDILHQTNEMICDFIRKRYSQQSPTACECMGTTALVAVIEKGILTLGAIGDSRAYIIRDTSMSCITRDHNLFTVGILNNLPVEMCAIHPHAGSLVQCLGYYEDDQTCDISYDLYTMHLIPGDTLMLTTDGILDYIACNIADSESRIAEIVRLSNSAALACLELIMQANVGGGGDNCGVGIVRVLAA